MKLCNEILESIEEVCCEYNQSDEFQTMLTKLIQNMMNDNIVENDIESVVKKVETNED